MAQTPTRTPQRPPRPPTRQLFLQDEPVDEQNSGDLLQQVLAKGCPSTLSVVQAIDMEEQYNFVATVEPMFRLNVINTSDIIEHAKVVCFELKF